MSDKPKIIEMIDYFAAKAMEAIINKNGNINTHESVAKFSYNVAKAMMEEREKYV